MPSKIDITGMIYGRLTIISQAESKGGRCGWVCKCECGNIITTDSNRLRTGNTKSCGCLHAEKILTNCLTHGFTKGKKIASEFTSWTLMKERCYNPKNKNYDRYGGRGVIVCERWLNSFQSFVDDMGLKPTKKHTIDRIDNEGNYEPNNCKWSTQTEQTRNRGSFHVWLDYKGVKMIMSDVARDLLITPEHLRALLRYKSVEQVIEHLKNKKAA